MRTRAHTCACIHTHTHAFSLKWPYGQSWLLQITLVSNTIKSELDLFSPYLKKAHCGLYSVYAVNSNCNYNKKSYVRKFSFIVREPKGKVWRTRVSILKNWGLEALNHFQDPRWTSVPRRMGLWVSSQMILRVRPRYHRESVLLTTANHPVDFTENPRPVFQGASTSLSLTPHTSWTAKGMSLV